MNRLCREERGQVIPLVGVLMSVVLLGIAALVIDLGVWYTKSRKVQTVADAAALAAVQDLPGNPTAALQDAGAYANANGGALSATPVISTTATTDDTISVTTAETTPTFFAKVFGITTMTVKAQATAQVSGLCNVSGAGLFPDGSGEPLPLVVSAQTVRSTPLNQTTTLLYGPADAVAGGQFGILDFANQNGGTSPGDVGDWISNGFPGELGCGWYQGVTGNKFNAPAVKDALGQVAASRKLVLLPVYPDTNGWNGGKMEYRVAGWAAFRPTAFSASGSTTTLTGSFVRIEMVPQGTVGEYFGVGHVQLTK